jgi:hypothetical protein
MTDVLNPEQFPPPTLLRGRLPVKPPDERYPLKWAHEYMLGGPRPAVFPVDVTEGLINLGMMGNDQYGNCGACGEVHEEMVQAVAAQVPGPLPDSTLAVDRYNAYDGNQPPPGPGVNLPDYLHWCFQQGFIKAWCPVDHTNVSVCASLMGEGFGLYIGVNLTDNNETQFNNGQPFDPAGLQPDPQDGHCVIWNYMATASGPHKVGTWGKFQDATNDWITQCLVQNPNGEAYLIITTEAQLAKFEPQLLADLQAIGGGDSAPAPQPEPAPPPQPQPTPLPVPPAPPPPGPPPPTPTPSPGWIQRLEEMAQEEVDRIRAEADKIIAWVESIGGHIT